MSVEARQTSHAGPASVSEPGLQSARVAVIGLGYVGLPLAAEFGKLLPTWGFDIDQTRIESLRSGHDHTQQLRGEELAQAKKLRFSSQLDDVRDCNVYIVSVPTPVDGCNRPDLTRLILASRFVGSVLKNEDTVIYESTVYPGATEEVCVPILEEESGLKFNEHFFLGYSPERINPGDASHSVRDIVKITSGSTRETADFVDRLYNAVIPAGTHRASSIKVAEAAKAIENTQRDVNIALINEFAMLFNRLGVDCQEVLEAAATKWNFMKFTPGLVGGHCIGVDPYYLTHKAQQVGYNPEMILAGRRINDSMGEFIAHRIAKAMLSRSINLSESRVLVMGMTFKENCPDLRNTKVYDLVRALQDFNVQVDVHDPLANVDEALSEYGIHLVDPVPQGIYDGIVIAVAHESFGRLGVDAIRRFGKSNHVLFDVKYLFPKDRVDCRL